MRHCAELWPISCQSSPARFFWDMASLPFAQGGVGLRSARSDSQGSFLVELGGLHADDPRAALGSVHVRHSSALRR